jgi:hypothetical protein
MAKSNANNPAVITCYLGTVSTTGVYPLTTLPRKFVITGIYLLDKAGIAADNTNYVTLTVKQGSTAVAALDTRAANQGAVTANVAKAFTLDAAYNGGVREPLPAGDLTLDYAEGGTGTTTAAQVVVQGYLK